MFHRHTLAVVCALLAGSCSGGDDRPVSQDAEPATTFSNIQPPNVNTGWPCPPFDFDTTQDKVGDSDGDSLTDCQEEEIGSLPNNPDSDGDGVGDLVEVGSVADPDDTDADGIPDILDDDDDGDGVPTLEEDDAPMGDEDGDPRNDDIDGDGIPNYLDNDDDNDLILALDEDAPPMGNGDGDPRNDNVDAPGDTIPNFLDPDDDNDGAAGCEDTNKNFNAMDDDTDGDTIPDVLDTDDDGDGIPTMVEDWDGDGDACNDDLDIDGIADFQDLDEDNDTLETLDEDRNDNNLVLDDDTDFDGIPNYRDDDDDGDGIFTLLEDLEFGVTDTGVTGVGDLNDDDTDEDGIPNYLDSDDDGDRCLTREEVDGKVPPELTDLDEDGVPDYLDADQANCASPRFDLRLDGSSFGGLNGDRVRAIVVLDGETVGGGEATIAAAGFTLDVPVVLAVGESYRIDFFVDEDDNGSCDGAEDAWRVTGVSTTGTPVLTTLTVAGNDPTSGPACSSFP